MSVDPRLTRRKVTVSLALSLLARRALGSAASAQERGKPLAAGDRITRLERQLEDLRQALEIPGISAAIVKDHKLQWSKGFGSDASAPTVMARSLRSLALPRPGLGGSLTPAHVER